MKKLTLIFIVLTAPAFAISFYSFDEAYPGLNSNSVVEIVSDSTGIWLGTVGGASYTTDDGLTWTTFRAGSGLTSSLVSAIGSSVYNDTAYICVGTLHNEEQAGQSAEVGDGLSLTTDGGITWDTLSPPSATWVGMLSWDIDIYQDDIYSACWYGGLVRLMDASQNREDDDWENLYLNTSDSLDLWVDSTFYNYTNYYFSVKVDTTLAPDTISVIAGSAQGINRYIFSNYGDGNKQDTAWNIIHDPADPENSLPGNHVVALATNGRPGRIYDVFVEGDYAYIAHGFEGLWIVDISNPDSLIAVGDYNTPGRAFGVTVDSIYAYVADYDRGLQIIDISDKSNPSFEGSFLSDGYVSDIVIEDNYAYLANEIRGLQIVDISNPSNPVLAYTNRYNTEGYGVKGIDISGDTIYLACDRGGLFIFDLTISPDSSLADSALISRYDLLTGAQAVTVDSNFAYVADTDSGLVAFDITDPANPVIAAYINTVGNARDVAFNDEYVFVTDEISFGIYEMVSDSNDYLVEAGLISTPGTASDFMITGDTAYIADVYLGMQVMDFSNIDSVEIAGNFAPVCSTFLWAACRIGAKTASNDVYQKYAVAYSPNYGITWTTVIEEPAWDFAFLGDTVIVATNDGLYISDNYQDWTVVHGMNDTDPERQRRYFPSGFFAVETVGSTIWAGGADGTVRIDGSDTTVFRSDLYSDDHFAYPSPFSPLESIRKGTTIHYKPPTTTRVTIKIYDFNLDLVKTLIDNETRPGAIDADSDVWDGKNNKGELVANGIYFYNIKLDTGEDWWGKVAVVK